MIDFAVAIIHLTSQLPNTVAGKHVSGQLLRSGTSPALNYGEARGAESTKDFIHKLGVLLKELNESEIWLKIIIRSKMLLLESVTPVANECSELCKIIASSIRTVGKRKK
ncbi:four helix bundle protein [candidate division KSB1 bacterium]|nr:four helix bundle protein [candidate division KSB1 bacterium]